MIALIDGLLGLFWRGAVRVLILLFAAVLAGCVAGQKPWPSDPLELVAPYSGTSVGGEVVWAVAPFRNESGVSVADELRVSDRVVEQIREVRGVSAVPLNRTLEAMAALGMAEVSSARQARALATRMGVDGIVVGTVTAWSPYEPPEIGLTVSLYARGGDAMRVLDTAGVDPMELVRSGRGLVTDPGTGEEPDGPLSTVSAHLSGSNGAVRSRVERYGTGRADPNSATGWEGYLTTMSRFERFAAFEMVGRLLSAERERLIRASDASRDEPSVVSSAL